MLSPGIGAGQEEIVIAGFGGQFGAAVKEIGLDGLLRSSAVALEFDQEGVGVNAAVGEAAGKASTLVGSGATNQGENEQAESNERTHGVLLCLSAELASSYLSCPVEGKR